MTEYTPGPWFIEDDVAIMANVDDKDIQLCIMAETRASTDSPMHELCKRVRAQRSANIHLIAAAPDLLEACKAFVIAWEKCLQLEKTDIALRMAKAAIAKAEK